MANVDSHAPGTFCWIELATTDQAAAKTFYNSVFGWVPDDAPMGPGEVYTMFKLQGRDAAAAYGMRPDQRNAGLAAHWLLYIAPENVDETAARVEQLGGKLSAPPFDVMDAGRMAPVQDPHGASFAIWQAKRNPGIGITGVDGTLCWADLSTPDPAAAARFYSGLLGWETTADPHTDYVHIKNGSQFIGGIVALNNRNPNAPPHWLPYFLSSNCDETADKASKAGAKLLVPPMTMENVGRMSVVADPQGAVFSI